MKTTITIIASIATIIGVIYTIWKDKNKPNKPSNMKNKQSIKNSANATMAGGDVNIDNSTKIQNFIGTENKEIEVEEIYRQPITLFGFHVRNWWLKLFAIFAFILLAYLAIHSLINLSERVLNNNQPSSTGYWINILFMIIILFAIYFNQVFNINELFHFGKSYIVNYSGKLHKAGFKGKCHCNGKVKIKQNLLNRNTPNYLQCQADKSHTASFYPSMFDENNYATA